ncbi:MAG: DUF2723 domain-containing protein [Candidatus Cloacimonetes bacterium]|nr:DUF2723 domain-containing protein [Candidatus Cloacimonadota bacterium]
MIRKNYKILLIIIIISICLYGFTLAPHVLWGDDAQFQRLANGWNVEMIPRGHILYSYLVKIVNIIPYFNIAVKVNFFSAFLASLTLPFLFLIILLLTEDKFSSLLSTIIFGLSHTFWLHAVRAEVHTLQLFLIALSLYLLLLWYKTNGKNRLLFFSFFIIGISLGNHILSIGLLPGMLFLAFKKTPNRRLIIFILLGLIPGVLILFFFKKYYINIYKILWCIFSGFHFPILKNLPLFLLFLIYQFLIATFIGIFGIKFLYRQDKLIFYFFMLAFLGNILEIVILPIHDQYVMFLPSFLIYSIFIGIGFFSLFKKIKMSVFKKTSFTVMICLLPIIVYWGTPHLLKHFKVNVVNIRTLRNRDNYTFFLFPPKNGYYGAYDFAKETLNALPENAVLLADFTISQPLLYFQNVENFRRDVEIDDIWWKSGKQTQYLLERSKTHTVFIADNNKYYNMDEFRKYFNIVPYGYIYKLTRISQE